MSILCLIVVNKKHKHKFKISLCRFSNTVTPAIIFKKRAEHGINLTS